MNWLAIILPALSASARIVEPQTNWRGVYADVKRDVRLSLYRAYFLEQGLPLSSPVDRRHVDFEEGDALLAGQTVILTPRTIFKSPCRKNYYSLFIVNQHAGYEDVFPTKEGQAKFLKEMSWRLTLGGAVRTLRVELKDGQVELHMGCITLRKLPDGSGPPGQKGRQVLIGDDAAPATKYGPPLSQSRSERTTPR